MLTKWLNRPYPFIDDLSVKILLTLLLGVIAFLFLYLFRPFNLDIVDSFYFMLGYGVTSALGVGFHMLVLPFLFPKHFNNENWTIWKQIIYICSMTLMIAVLNYLHTSIIGAEIAPQYDLMTMIIMTFGVGIIPIIVFTYVSEKYATKQNEFIAKSIQLPVEKQEEDTLTVTSQTNNDDVTTILRSAFLYAESDKNYSELHYLFQGEVKKKLIRVSLKNLIDQWKDSPQCIRCHRSFIVNKEQIKSVSGNARSLLINLNHIEKPIPVSRGFDKSLLA